MKKLFLTILLLLPFLFFQSTAYAQENLQSGESIILEKDKTINSDYFAAGETVTISGTINGDAYLGGGRIIVDGDINGDLIAGGGEIVINGNVAQNIRIAGGNITISGNVGRNATVLGGNVNLTNSANITGSLVSGAGNLTIYSPIGTDIYLGAGNVTIGNSVGGKIDAGVGSLTLTSNASVKGDIDYISESAADILPGASISGKLTHTLPPQKPEIKKEDAVAAMNGFSAFTKIIGFISLAIIGLLIIKFFPKFSAQAADSIGLKFWNNLLVGFLAIILTPLIFILLLISIIGIPLAFILISIFGIAVCVSKIFVAIWTGNFVAKKLNQKWNSYITYLIGLGLLTLIGLIPIAGFIISTVVLFVGFGTLLITKKDFYQKLKNQL